MTAESATEFSDYLTMETFFNAESAMGGNGPGSQQNYPNTPTNQNPNTSDYSMMAPLENAYSYENSLGEPHHSEKYEYHNNNNNNNNVQYFYENSNSVQTQQQSLISQHPSEFFVSTIPNTFLEKFFVKKWRGLYIFDCEF